MELVRAAVMFSGNRSARISRTLTEALVASSLFLLVGFGGCGAEVTVTRDVDDAISDADGAPDVAVDVADTPEDTALDDGGETTDLDVTVSDDTDTVDVADAELEDLIVPDTSDATEPDVADATEDVDDAADSADSLDVEELDTLDAVDVSGDGPFDDLADLSDGALRAALLARIKDHTILGYEGVGTARQVLFAVVDAVAGRLECIYTGRTVAAEDPNSAPLGPEPGPAIDTTPDDDCRWPDGSPVIGGCFFSAEHSWPRALGANNPPASSDLHHLFPSFELANNQRGSYLFGETVCAGNACQWSEGESELGERSDGQKVFQVRQRFRGDIARAQFYFAVRYDRNIDATVEATLRAWHQQDPPDSTERERNRLIETFQNNRNPFVDRPDFVGRVSDF